MPCVGEEEAVKAAKKKALGLLSFRSKEAVVVKVGEDWLVGFVSAKHKDDETSIQVKWAYVDCKGVALDRIPQDVESALRGLLDDIPAVLKRELGDRVRR